MKELLWDALLDAFQLEDRSLPKTIFRLVKEPGTAIREVIHGQRRSLYPPFKFLVLAGAIIIVCSLRYHFFSSEYTHDKSGSANVFQYLGIPERYRAFFENFFAFAEDNATILNIAAIPVFALFSWWWLSRSAYNFAENLVLNTFITAQQLVFLVLLIPFYEFFPENKSLSISIYITGIAVYNIWVYVQFFGRSPVVVLRSAAAVLAGYVCQFPFNFLIFYLYEHFIKGFFMWTPQGN
ncbi:MAG: DUF3667 domain-containing protein [Chryseolinea sp.]